MTLTYISCSSDFYTFYVEVPLSLGCIIWKISAEDIALRGNGTGLEYMCPTRHFVYIFFNPVLQLSTAKNEINLFNNHILIVAPVTFAAAGAMTPSAEFLSNFTGTFRMVWRYAYCFFQNPEIIFYHIFFIFNLDFFRALILQKCIGSMYLVCTTPPKVSGQSFWNFTHAFRMVWRYAYCFFRILKLFFITFYCIFNLDFFVFSLWFHIWYIYVPCLIHCSGGARCMACSFISAKKYCCFDRPVLKKKEHIRAWRCPSVRQHTCMLRNSVTIQNIFMQFYRNMY